MKQYDIVPADDNEARGSEETSLGDAESARIIRRLKRWITALSLLLILTCLVLAVTGAQEFNHTNAARPFHAPGSPS